MSKESIPSKEKDFIREFFKQWPRCYTVAVYFLGPAYLGGVSPRSFLRKYFPKQNVGRYILNIGSGPVRLRSDVVNLDITKYSVVDIVADITNLPLEANSVDGFVCDNVLEHVIDPKTAVAEMVRVLKPGGVGYISTPFMYPFHASPYDYQRWTAPGLEELLKDFGHVEVGVRSGMFSTLSVFIAYIPATLFSFGSDRLFWLLVNVTLLFIFPLKFLDVLFNKLPFSTHTASVFYCIVKKV